MKPPPIVIDTFKKFIHCAGDSLFENQKFPTLSPWLGNLLIYYYTRSVLGISFAFRVFAGYTLFACRWPVLLLLGVNREF